MPTWPGADPRALTDPTGNLGVLACRLPGGDVSGSLYSPDPATGSHQNPAWRVHTTALPAQLILAAARAAGHNGENPAAVVRALRAADWNIAAERHLGGLLKRRWQNPDGSRSATWHPHAPLLQPGGWLITRPDPADGEARFTASLATPTGVVAALALTD